MQLKKVFDATTNLALPVRPEFDGKSVKQERIGDHVLLPIHLTAHHLGEERTTVKEDLLDALPSGHGGR